MFIIQEMETESCLCPVSSGDPYAAPVQLHGGGSGEEREDPRPGHLLPRSRRQQHPAQLHRGRRDNPAGPRGPRRVALRREREDEDVSSVFKENVLFAVSEDCSVFLVTVCNRF